MIDQLWIDFSGRRSLKERFQWVLLAIAGLAALSVGIAYFVLSSQLEDIEAQKQALLQSDAYKSTSNSPSLEDEKMHSRLESASKVVDSLVVPWDEMFQAIEESVGDDVTLLELNLDPETKAIQFTAEAKDIPAMIAYIERMQKVDLFSEPRITSHRLQILDPQRPVRFVGSATWSLPAHATSDKSITVVAPDTDASRSQTTLE